MYAPNPAPSTLYGRDRELAIMREQLTAALVGRGSLVLIGGEAGIGKTALAEVIGAEAAARGALVLVGRCFDLTETPPYGPWIELFGRYQPTAELPPLPDVFAVRGTVGAVSSQDALFRQVLDFLTALATARPVILLLDDLHWADPASLALLRFLARSLAALPLLLIATYRSDELTRGRPLSPLLPLLVREAGAERIDLHPLDDGAVRALVAMRYRLAGGDADRLVAYLHGRAEGNALFVGEVLRSLEERGALARDRDGWRLGDLSGHTVPSLLKQVIEGRVARLDTESQRLLGVAAVIGQEVPLAVWAAVAEVDEEALLPVIEAASVARLVEPTEDGTGIRFVHALTREALYEGILPPRRRVLHRRVGEVLAGRKRPDPDAVASHLQRAGDARAVAWLVAAGERAQRARAWLTAANRFEAALVGMDGDHSMGERAWLLLRVSHILFLSHLFGGQDVAKAIAHADEAGALAEGLKDAGLAAYARGHRAWISVATGDVARGMAELGASLVALRTLAADAAETLAHRAAPIAVMADWRERMALWCAFSGRFRDAYALSEMTAAGASSTDDAATPAGGFLGHDAAGIALAFLGMPEAAAERFAGARAAALRAHDLEVASNAAMREVEYVALPYRTVDIAGRNRLVAMAEEYAAQAIRAEPMLARYIVPHAARLPVLTLEGGWDEAERMRPDRRTREGDARGSVYLAERHLLLIAHRRGDGARAWSVVRDTLPMGAGTEPGTVRRFMNVIVAQRTAILLSLDAGDLDVAHQWLEVHDRWQAWSGAVLGLSEGQALWARYHRQAGDSLQAREHAERALALATEPRQPLALLAAHRLLGEQETEAGSYASAVKHFDAALVLADACRAPYERALTQLALADLRAAMGERDAAADLLDAARATLVPLEATPALARAEALAHRLAHAPPPVSIYPDGLTAREVEVLRLVAAGRSNRQIAAALFISERTVNRHLTNLYTKIDAHSKADATAWALRHHLA